MPTSTPRFFLLLPLTALSLALACGDKEDDTGPDGSTGDGGTEDGGGTADGGSSDGGSTGTDADGDGVTVEAGDCDDSDADVYPGAPEQCNGEDDNCNDAVDEGFADTDGDSIADCVDTEDCDGIDNDGDGSIDEGFSDTDSDGIADCTDVEECDGVDNDGDGSIDEGFDADGDGVSTCDSPADCDDEDDGRSPLLDELAGDMIDNDCDLLVDEGDWAHGDLVITEIMVNPSEVGDTEGEWFEVYNASGAALYLNGITIESATGESHQVDPDDLLLLRPGELAVLAAEGDPELNGGVAAVYGYDDIFLFNEGDDLSLWAGDVLLDEVAYSRSTHTLIAGSSLALDTYFYDADDNDEPTTWCDSREPWIEGGDLGSPGGDNDLCPNTDHDVDGYSADDGDCDDTDPDVGPGAAEVWYDGFDQDCDGASDYDADGDGYDSDDHGGTDCDDSNEDANPGETERCDEDDIDEDCNGLSDDDDPAVVGQDRLYPDNDNDGYGTDSGDYIESCEDQRGYGIGDDDCDDFDRTINPGVAETWYDGIDQDCDEWSDYDADYDGFDHEDYGGTDCDDSRDDVNTDQVEICDTFATDEDCNGVADEEDPGTTDLYTYYPDEDGDGYGSTADIYFSCSVDRSASEVGGDCDDDDPGVNPDETETWYDGVDQDCDGWSDYDADGDGFDLDSFDGTDCDDDDRSIFPYALEDASDGVDNDCDGDIDTDDRDTVTSLSLSDDDYEIISFDRFSYPLCDSDYSSLYVSSNGHLTFSSGSTSLSESSSTFERWGAPVIAGWWDDLNPSSAGEVYWQEFGDAVAIYFVEVTEYSASNDQTFDYILLDDGRLILSYENMDAVDGLVGWSCGDDGDFADTDLTEEMLAVPQGSAGIGKGTESGMYELFTTTADVSYDTFIFCAQAGEDLDGDGWSSACGDLDDEDELVYPYDWDEDE